MPFQCPDCSTPGSLRITAAIELPPDASWDEIALQIVRCPPCGFSGLGVYQESRRGALDSEIIHHSGYHVNNEDLETAARMIRKCPNPANPKCDCAAHRELGRKDERGYWDGLSAIRLGSSFEMMLK